ncbi:MAG: hypothetical protein PW789_08975 [Edaphobacter sp.]|uniref:hypothetical protein n=1 Tax=Edaphobacter sp. TaxID=1934404 RepID=UPI0023996AB3|nr:hypothetical protein [Edaphobacter sp.]MDE1176729.1 hypothetical protein [Edaphobacter sp.]
MDIQMEINAAETGLEEHNVPVAHIDFEERFAALEKRIEELAALCVSAAAAVHAPEKVTNSRKTLPTATTTLLAKQGVSVEAAMASVEAGALDGALDQALAPLSIEQRIAVKSQLLRAGLLH